MAHLAVGSGITMAAVAVLVAGLDPASAMPSAPLAAAAPVASGFWSTGTVPANASSSDAAAIELGLKFGSSVAGSVTGVRFFKGSGNTGTHTGSLWSGNGTRLATGTFTNETGTGWQTLNFVSPVAIAANATYVASYYAPAGHYAYTSDQFITQLVRSPLTAPARSNGVYRYGSSGFPISSYQSTNYWVDPLFVPGSTSTTSSGTPKPTTSISTSTTTPNPTTTTSGTTSPVSGTMRLCANRPSSCGYPDATNTGVVSGIALTKVPSQASKGAGWHLNSTGDTITVDGNGAVLENVDSNLGIDVIADNVTIRNVRITTWGESWAIGLKHTKNATVQNVDIVSAPGENRLIVAIKDVYGDATGTQVLRTDISGVSTGIQTHEGLIQDNYIHDFGYLPGDHTNGTTSNGSTVPLTIRHNTILNQLDQADAVSLFQDFGLEANRLIDNNLVAGGSYSIYAGQNRGAPTVYNIKLTNNRFSRIYFSTGGTFGPVAAYNKDAPGAQFTGNVWDDTDAAIPTPGGY